MKHMLLFLWLITTLSCAQDKKPVQGQSEWQLKMNADFKDATKSPLLTKDRKQFDGLDFFDFNDSYIVQAQLTRTPNTEFFNMRTTTDRVSQERVYGILTFKLNGKAYKLNVYQGKENMQTEGYEDYLFLPFLDNTNGGTSYGGGRYIDLRIPEGDSIDIDFNKSYNPYCVYNEKFSCPIVPRSNYLDIEIMAGVKAFKKKLAAKNIKET